MSTSDVNVPPPRSAELGVAAQVPPYPVPRHLTPGGTKAFQLAMDQYALAIGAELDGQAAQALSRGEVPEHTAEAVASARSAYLRRLQSDAIEQTARRVKDRSVLAAILLTVATVGLGIMPNFLHSSWQRGLFVVFIAVGVIGLGLMWTGRRHPADPKPPSTPS